MFITRLKESLHRIQLGFIYCIPTGYLAEILQEIEQWKSDGHARPNPTHHIIMWKSTTNKGKHKKEEEKMGMHDLRTGCTCCGSRCRSFMEERDDKDETRTCTPYGTGSLEQSADHVGIDRVCRRSRRVGVHESR